MLTEVNGFNAFQMLMILYLTIADGMHNPFNVTKLYTKYPLIRYAYTLFGAYNVFGSDVGMGLGWKTGVAVSIVMMLLLDAVPYFLSTPEELKESEFVPFLDLNWQSMSVAAILAYLYFFR